MWKCLLELDSNRNRISGCETQLANAIRRGADLRIYTEFLYNEHIDVLSNNPELVQEVSEFRVTYLLDDAWVAGIMNLRQPIEPPKSFGPRPSMSFFLYNQNGQQAIARPHLDGLPATGERSPATAIAPPHMPKYHAQDAWDLGTNAPSSNFIYDFERYRFQVNDSWREVFAHDAEGNVTSGSLDALTQAANEGNELKVGVRNLCVKLGHDAEASISHETFVHLGPCYYNTQTRIFSAGSHPLVRVAPAVPMRYESDNWDFGWLLVRSDGTIIYRCCSPYTLQFSDSKHRLALRWFVRT